MSEKAGQSLSVSPRRASVQWSRSPSDPWSLAHNRQRAFLGLLVSEGLTGAPSDAPIPVTQPCRHGLDFGLERVTLLGDSWLHLLDLISAGPEGSTPPTRLVNGARRDPWETPMVFPDTKNSWLHWLTGRIRSTPNTWVAWMADMAGIGEPDVAFPGHHRRQPLICRRFRQAACPTRPTTGKPEVRPQRTVTAPVQHLAVPAGRPAPDAVCTSRSRGRIPVASGT